jgi:hypothetical protein
MPGAPHSGPDFAYRLTCQRALVVQTAATVALNRPALQAVFRYIYIRTLPGGKGVVKPVLNIPLRSALKQRPNLGRARMMRGRVRCGALDQIAPSPVPCPLPRSLVHPQPAASRRRHLPDVSDRCLPKGVTAACGAAPQVLVPPTGSAIRS